MNHCHLSTSICHYWQNEGLVISTTQFRDKERICSLKNGPCTARNKHVFKASCHCRSVECQSPELPSGQRIWIRYSVCSISPWGHSTHFAECDSMVRQVTNSIFLTNQFYTKGNLLLIPKEEFSPFHTEKISPWETSSDFTALSMYIGNGVSVIFKKLGRRNLSATYPGPAKAWAVVLPHSRTGSIVAVFPKVVSSYQNNSVEGWKKIKRKVPINMESV